MNPRKTTKQTGRVDVKYRVSRWFHKQLVEAAKRERRTIQAYVDLAVTERLQRKTQPEVTA